MPLSHVDRDPSRWAIARGRGRSALATLAVLAGLSLAAAAPVMAYEPGDLAKVEAMVRAGYADVAQLPTELFAELTERGERLLVFDVREEEEFRVSHLPGAIRVDPGTWSWTFLRDHAEAAKGKRLVFYCSVGVRSSRLAGRVQDALMERGASGVYNLAGGLFRWHNEGRALVDETGPTPLIHPYDAHWGGLIERRQLTATSPRAAQAAAPR